MLSPDEHGIIVRLKPSPMRRVLALTTLYALGGLILFVAAKQPPAFQWLIVMVVIALGAIWLGEKLRRATRHELQLTPEAILRGNGEVLIALSDIEKVERGTFAFKPSNGFVLIAKSKLPRKWLPGIWWQVGRRIGVGGVVSGPAAKFMAEQISARLSD